jgi:predicted RNA binding protein YcfA (HicA-like mRNA interferase family)
VRPHELLARMARGEMANVKFADAERLVLALGFHLVRVKGSHHVYAHQEITELVNLQPQGAQAKPYQLRQVMRLVESYDLELEDDR